MTIRGGCLDNRKDNPITVSGGLLDNRMRPPDDGKGDCPLSVKR